MYMRFPQKVRYTRKNLSGPVGLEFGVNYPDKFRFGLIVAACLAYTLSLFWTTYQGATILQPLMPAAWTIFVITSPVFPRIVLRSFIKVGLGVMVRLPNPYSSHCRDRHFFATHPTQPS
jgi:hypothetical protein